MKKLLLFIVVLSFDFVFCSIDYLKASQSFGMKCFMIGECLKMDNECNEDFISLQVLDAYSAYFIASFWEAKANVSFCKERQLSYEGCKERIFRKKVTQESTDEALKTFAKELEAMYYVYFYDHWDEIKNMVHLKLEYVKREKQKKSKTL